MVKLLNAKYCSNSHVRETGADMIAPLIQAAIVEKNCGEYLTEGNKSHARLNTSSLVSWGLQSKEESRVQITYSDCGKE